MTTARSRARDLAPELRSVVLTHDPDAETLDLMRPGGAVPLAVLQEANRAVAAEMLRQGVVVLVQQADWAAAGAGGMRGRDGTGSPAAWRDRSRLLHGAEALRRIGVEAPAPSRPEKGAGTPADRLMRLFASEDGAAFEACAEALIGQGRDGVLEQAVRKVAQIARYDRPDTQFYLDPPYWGCERDYGPGVFDRADFERLAEQLAAIQGRFLLSLNDTPGVREVFGRFAIEAVETTYGISGKPQRAGEVLISNA
ncbi:hypothetical protein [Teichococcus aestuarii]|uniref:hypothetical protein n=1 Tax=Teichococcus aestuarii TaxID=568898 RepID=UPI0015E80715|nr:hypothetical protein [Pseudoroseomonas aestuarii]